MRRTTIGGTLDLNSLRTLHRPLDRDAMRAAVVEMARRGMTDYAIAQATELAVEQVRRLLGEGTR